MDIGLIGLGKMGGNMRTRLRNAGHTVVGYDRNPDVSDVDSLEALVAALPSPKVVWVMVPSGDPTRETVKALGELLDEGDVVVEGGNSRWTDDQVNAAILAEKGIQARVVSMPCREWFDEQEPAYRETVIPPTLKARVAVEAGVAQGWREIVGDAGRSISIEHFGASADAKTLFTEFGFTPEAVVKAAKDSIKAASNGAGVPGAVETAPRTRKDTGTDVPTTKKPARKSAATAGK